MRMLHLGLGSFHRAHQAVYMHHLQAQGDRRWTLAGGNIRADMEDTIAALRQQRCLYTLETVSPALERNYERIGSIAEVVPHDRDLSGLVALGSDPDTRIISFTVTEAGYYLGRGDRLDMAFPDLLADVAAARAGRAGTTLYGALTAILRARRARGAGPVTLLCCDNLRHNGDRSRAGLLQFIAQAEDPALLAWVERHTTSPNAMVDRITPRPAPEVAQRVRAATGIEDRAALMAESFLQWVIEDRFAGGRPAWESVGVEMVDSVTPHEEAKIRLLNATHSCVAWAGTLAGTRYIHEGVRDARIHRFAHDYATQDVIPLLSPSPVDLARYRDTVLERFGNPALEDTNQRVAMDGFSKLPGFILPTVRERLGRGESIDAVAVLPALFMAYLRRWHQGRLPHHYEDQAMDPEAAHALCAAADPLRAFCETPALWAELAGDTRLLAALRRAAARVESFEEEASWVNG